MNEKMLLNTKITNINTNTIIELLVVHLGKLCKDVGQSPDDVDISRVCERMSDMLLGKYRGWTWAFVPRMFERGLSEEFGKFQRITVKLMYSWMRQMEEGVRVDKSRQNQQHEKELKKKAPHIYAENSEKYGKWIISNLQKNKGEEWESLHDFEERVKSKINKF